MRSKANALTTTLAAAAILSTAVRSFALESPATSAAVAPATSPAGGPATAPGAGPGGAIELSVTITSVKGMVQVRLAEDQPWKPAKPGMKLGQGAEFRTGLRSAVQFVIEPDQVITLDRLGTLKVLQAFQDRNKVTTDLGVKYGRTRYDIQNADLEHQSTIRSPGSTLAIRGTDVTYEDQVPWVPSAVSRHGRAEFREFSKDFVPFGGNKKAVVSADKNGPAQQAIATTRIDPRTAFAGRSAGEENLLLTLPSSGGIDAQGEQALQNLFKYDGFAPAAIGVLNVPGPLNIQLNWYFTAGTPNPSVVDLQVTEPNGKSVLFSPTNTTIGTGTATGMFTTDFSPSSGQGVDTVVWPLFFPFGRYKVKAISQSGDPAQVFISASQGNPPAFTAQLQMYGSDPNKPINLKPGQSFTGIITPQLPPKGR
jgi:hypothetical protein